MKKFKNQWLLSIAVFLFATNLNSQIGKVGINTTTPSAMLHVKDSSVVFTGFSQSGGPGDPPISGPGARMMWYAARNAFRVGNAISDEWDKNNIGIGSIALGNSVKASGTNSVAIGAGCSAFAANSIAMGIGCTVLNSSSIAMGNSSTAHGSVSIALGFRADASGLYSTAIGKDITSRSINCFTIGTYNDSIITSDPNDWVDTDPLFIVGNGNATRRNAFIVTKNAKVGINIANGLPQAGLHIKALDGTNDAHLRLEGFSSNSTGNISYNNSNLVLRNNAAFGGFYFMDETGTPLFSVYYNGTATVEGELVRTSSGSDKNLVPICYGSVSSTGTINSGTSNYTPVKTGTGEYEISIVGESYGSTGYSTTVTAINFSGPRFATTVGLSGKLVVSIWDLTGNKIDAGFHFVVYKQ